MRVRRQTVFVCFRVMGDPAQFPQSPSRSPELRAFQIQAGRGGTSSTPRIRVELASWLSGSPTG